MCIAIYVIKLRIESEQILLDTRAPQPVPIPFHIPKIVWN